MLEIFNGIIKQPSPSFLAPLEKFRGFSTAPLQILNVLLGAAVQTTNILVGYAASVHILNVLLAAPVQKMVLLANVLVAAVQTVWCICESFVWMYIGFLTSIASWFFGTNGGTTSGAPGEEQKRRYQFVFFSWQTLSDSGDQKSSMHHITSQLEKKQSLIDAQLSELEQKDSLIDDLQHEIARLSEHRATLSPMRPDRSPLKVLMPSAIRDYFDLDPINLGLDSDSESDSQVSSFSEEIENWRTQNSIVGGSDLNDVPDDSSSSFSSKRDPKDSSMQSVWTLSIDPTTNSVELLKTRQTSDSGDSDEDLFSEQSTPKKTKMAPPTFSGKVRNLFPEMIEGSETETPSRKNTYTAKE